MSDLKKFGKKLFASVVTGMTAFSMSFGAFLPAVVHAATTCPEVEAWDLVKVPGKSAVYFINADMERMYFPSADVYMTWFEDFSSVKEIPVACIDNYPSGGGVNFRPGSKLVKTDVSPNVYAIGVDNWKHKIPSESVASALYGANWAKTGNLYVLPDVFDANYKMGSALSETAMPHNGMLVQMADATKVYYVWEGKLVEVTGTLPAFVKKDVRVVSEAVFESVSMGEGTVTAASLTSDPSQMGGEPSEEPGEEEPTSGSLTFSLAGSTPESSTVPGGAQNVEYLKFNVTGDGDMLDSLTVKLGGIGDRTDFSKVYLYNEGVRIGSGHSVNSDDEVVFNVNMEIDGTETFTVTADMNTVGGSTATAGDRNFFQIVNAEAIDTTAEVKGTFPIQGNEMLLGSQNITAVNIEASGSDTTEKIGQDDVLISEFEVSASSTDDVWFSSIALENKGSARLADTISNVIVRHNGVEVATGEISDEILTVTFDELFEIEASDSEVFKIYADLGIAEDADTIKLVLDETTDLVAYADDYPESRIRVTNQSLDATGTGGSTAAITITLDGGDINVDFEGNNEDVRPDQDNVQFGVFSIVSLAEDMDIDSMEFELLKNAGNPCLEDLRLRDVNGNGSYTLENTDTCASSGAQYTYTVEDLVLQKGTEYEFEVLADIASTATSGSQYHFTWAAAQVTGEGVSSDNTIAADMFSSASLTGPTMSVGTSSLTVRSSALTDDSVVNGTENVLFFRGTLEAGDTSDVTVTAMTFEDENGTAWSNRIDGLRLYVESEPGEGINIETDEAVDVDNTVSSDAAVFNGFEIEVGKGSSGATVFEVYGDITDGSTTGTVDVKLTSVSANDEDSETVAAQTTTGTAISSQPLTTARDITIGSTGTVTLIVDNDFTGLRQDKWILSGTEKALVGRIQVLSANEDVKIEDLGLRVTSSLAGTSQADVENTFDTISVYSCADLTSDCLLATEDFSFTSWVAASGTLVINDINFEVEDAVKGYLYLTLDVNADGIGVNGTAVPSTSVKFALYDAGTTAEGVNSNSDLAAGDITATNTTFTKVAAAASVVISEVESTFDGGSLVGGDQTIFSFAVTADANGNTDDVGNTLEAIIGMFKIQISTDIGTEANITNLRVCSVETGTCATATTSAALTSSNTSAFLTRTTGNFFATTDFSTDEISIPDGETKEFAVKATLGGTTDKFIQGSIQDLNAGGVFWGYDTDNSGSADVTHGDMKMAEPRPVSYPDVFGGSLD